MAFDALIQTEPDPTHGYVIQRPATSGEWRFCLELADPSAGDYAEWFDLTQFYAGDRYQRGADEYMGRYRASVAQVQLQIDNVHADGLGVSRDILAPWGQDTTDLFGVDVELDAGLLMRTAVFRVDASETVEWSPLWTGRVETWGDAAYARGQVRIHQVQVVDLIADLVNVSTVVESPGYEWDDWFTEVLTEAGWLYGVDQYGDFTDAGLPFDDTPQAAINRLDAGCDPLGLVWRTLRSGRMVIHPAPWDTTNTDRYDNPLLDVYPDGLVFSYSPDFTDIDYIADDDQEPFGITRTSLGVVNSIVATMPGDPGPDPEVYAIDDPVSIDKFGTKPTALTWILNNPPVADDLLAARAYASRQALPLRTTIDQGGFWPAMAIVDHLDPVTVIHASHETGTVVTVTGTIRNVTEERTYRHETGLTWQSTVQLDVTALEVSEALLPVEDLLVVPDAAPTLGGPSSAVATWTNPTQPDVTPTDVEYRVLGKSLIWNPATYDGVGASGLTLGWLEQLTEYTLQVRLIRQVSGITTHASPIKQYTFTTPINILPIPTPGEDPTDTDVIGTPPDDECDDFTIELQENDGTGWSTVDTFTGSELLFHPDPWVAADGTNVPGNTYSLTYEIPNSFFNDGSLYRYRQSCDGETWETGPSFDPPADWTDPCTTPPALSDPPFDDEDLIVYVPKICAS